MHRRSIAQLHHLIQDRERGFVCATPAQMLSRMYAFYVVSVLSVVLLAIFLNLPNYGNALSSMYVPKYWYFLFIALLFPAFMPNRDFVLYLFSPFSMWSCAFILVNVVHLLGSASNGDLERDAAIATRVQFLALATLLGFALSNWRCHAFDTVFRLLAVLAPSLLLLDFFIPGLFYALDTPGTVPGRAAATYVNPTIASEAVLVIFMLACSSVKPSHRAALYFLVGAGVAATFSRSGIVAWLALGLFLQVRGMFPRSGYFWMLGASLAAPIVLAAAEAYLGARSDLDGALANLQERLKFFSDLHVGDESSRERIAVLQAAWDLFMLYPLEGAGAAATSTWYFPVGPHNQLIMQAAEYGLVGIGFWLAMLVILATGNGLGDRNVQLGFVFLFVFFSMFSHTMFDMLYWLIAFALASDRSAVRSGGSR